METITLQYNPRNKFALALIKLIKASDAVKIIDDDANNAEFVAKIKRSQQEACEGKCKTIKVEDLWN
ncbi:MAG: hypothetical protein IJQ11_11530 [Bacteroidales bacterium]|nr:hypothetical protein [Bacteroidales bacterium]